MDISPRFKEVWTEQTWRTCAQLAETEVIRYRRFDRRTTVWVEMVILETDASTGRIVKLIAHGITEGGVRVVDDYAEGVDDYPQEIAALIPEISKLVPPCQADSARSAADDE
jgi:CRISPR/Cas system-associated protein Csm6